MQTVREVAAAEAAEANTVGNENKENVHLQAQHAILPPVQMTN